MPDPFRPRPDGHGMWDRARERTSSDRPPMPLFDFKPPKEFDARDPSPLRDDAPAGRVDTSREAFAESVRTGNRSRQQRAVYDAIQASGSFGRTLDEVCVLLDLQTQSVSPRINELSRAGLVRRSGVKRKTRQNRAAHVWIVAASRSWRDEHGDQDGR